jgi:hypothetical protein
MFNNLGWSPTDVADLVFWGDASKELPGASVLFTDRSGSGNHAVGTGTVGTTVQNGLRTMRFNGTTDKFATPNVDWTAVNAFTICTVFKSNSVAVDQAICTKGYSGYPFASEGTMFYIDTSVSAEVKGAQYSAGNNFNVKDLDADNGQSFAVRSQRVNRALAAAYQQSFTRDGGICYDPVTFGGTAAAAGLGNSPIYIGVHGNGTNIPLSGDIAEILIFSRRLTDDELRRVEMYLGIKWALPYRSIYPLGNSITYGDVNDGWRGPLMDSNLITLVSRGNLLAPGVYHHEGHPGAAIAFIDANITGYWNSARGREILLTIGTNDALTPGLRAGMLAAYDTLLNTIDALSPAPSIVWCATLTPLGDAPSDAAVNTFNAGLPAVVAGHPKARYVDVGSCLTVADLADFIHPTPAGFLKMGQRWANVLNGLVIPP